MSDVRVQRATPDDTGGWPTAPESWAAVREVPEDEEDGERATWPTGGRIVLPSRA